MDLSRLLKMLRQNGVSSYSAGGVSIVFGAEPVVAPVAKKASKNAKGDETTAAGAEQPGAKREDAAMVALRAVR